MFSIREMNGLGSDAVAIKSGGESNGVKFWRRATITLQASHSVIPILVRDLGGLMRRETRPEENMQYSGELKLPRLSAIF